MRVVISLLSSCRLRGTDVFACEAKVLCRLSGRENSEVGLGVLKNLISCMLSQ